MENYDVLLYPLISEKADNSGEVENKITFVVKKSATKQDIKRALEDAYKVKVDSISILNDNAGRKKAIIKLNKQFKASDLSNKLGMV